MERRVPQAAGPREPRGARRGRHDRRRRRLRGSGRRGPRMRFAGKVAVVSGASSGIGLAVAERLGAEGATLVRVAAPDDEADLERSVERLRAGGVEAEGVAADIAEEETARTVTELASSRFG